MSERPELPGGPLPPFGPLIADLSAWVLRVAEVVLVLGAFQLAQQLSGSGMLHYVNYVLRGAAFFMLYSDIWRRAEAWWAHPNFQSGARRWIMQLLSLAAPVAAMLFFSTGVVDEIVDAVQRSM